MAILTPFDLRSSSPLVDLAGVTPPGADMRRSFVIGAQREWGALEYNSAVVVDAAYITPFDLRSSSPLVNLAGTSPPTADARGSTVQGAEREWGALEYDSSLLATDDVPGSSYFIARIAVSSDDARENSGVVGLTGANLSAANGNNYLGFRWDGVPIDNGEAINFAQLWLSTPDVGNDSPGGATIGIQDADDAPTFTTTTNDISNRTLLATLVTWDGLDLGVDEFLAAVLTDQVQDVVNRGGWANGNAIVSVLRGDNDGDLQVVAWDGTPSRSARIVINYGGGDVGETLDGAITLAGVGSFAVSGKATRSGALSLTGAGTFATAGQRLREALLQISGVGAIVLASQRVREGIFSVAGAGALASAAERVREGALSLPGIGTLTAAASTVLSGAMSLAGAGSLTTAGQRLLGGALSLTGVGSLSWAGQRLREAALSLPGVGAFAGAGSKIASGAASFLGEGFLALDGQIAGIIDAAISFVGVGSLSSAASRITNAALSLTGQGALASAGQKVVEAALSLPGVGVLVIAGQRLRSGAVSLAGVGGLTTAASRIASASVSFIGVASLVLTSPELIMVGVVHLTAKARQLGLTAKERVIALTARRRDED